MSYKVLNNDAVITIEGNLSSEENFSAYERDISLVVAEHAHSVVLDLSNLDTIDTIGVSIILKLYKNINALKGSVSFINANENIKTVLDNFKISDLIA